MARKRFTKEEAAAFVPGTRVEWRNGSHWHPGIIKDNIEADGDGWQFAGLTNEATTRTLHAGQYLRGYPGAVRVPVAAK